MTFDLYSRYYDLLYADKDYKAEVDYILDLIWEHTAKKPESILDMGCGTGKHAAFLAQEEIIVQGIDLSEKMIAIAKQNKSDYLGFKQADVRTFRMEHVFDVVISLFHVASYQTQNSDFENFLKTAWEHLKPSGLFIFDFWYGSAVLTDKPETRIKRLENEKFKITRLAEPKMDYSRNIVEVNYEIQIQEKSSYITEIISEQHTMRYWFLPEILYFAQKIGFKVLWANNWMTEIGLDENTWYGLMVLEK